MRGPFWDNDPSKTGVTGEPAFRTQAPNFVTMTNDAGKTITLTGAAADQHRLANA